MSFFASLGLLGLLVSVSSGLAFEQAPSRLVGRPLVDVLRELQEDGLLLLYSSDLVPADARVEYEPTATTLAGALEHILGPHGLRPEIGPRGRILIVRRERSPIAVTIVSPTRYQAALGEVKVRLEVAADEPVREIELRVNDDLLATMTGPPFEATIDVGQENVDREFRARARGAWGGTGSGTVTTRRVRFEDNLEVGLRQVYVTVSRGGRPLSGLSEADFTLWDDDFRHELVTFSGGDTPLTVALLLDVSESMQGPRSVAAREGARHFLSKMRGLDQSMVLLFSDKTLAVTPFAPYKKGLLDRLALRFGGGGTALTDHLYAALRLLDRQQGRRIIVLLSDGADVSSVLRMEDVAWKLSRSNATLYWIRSLSPGSEDYSSAWRSSGENRREREGLEKAVRHSGGRIVPLTDLSEIASAFDEVMSELRAQYVLGYYPRPRQDGSWREVRVEVSRSRAEVRMRKGYTDF